VTVSNDHTARFWNYETLKCEMVHSFRTDEPISVALHSSGFQVLVSFKDRVRMYNVLMDKLRPYKETVQKMCREVRFSNGCQYWAAASTINVVVYETTTFQQLMSFQGHMMAIKRIAWAPGDQVIFSAGIDGNVYGWPVTKDARIDVVAANNRTSSILGMAIDCGSTVFPKVNVKDDGGGGGGGDDSGGGGGGGSSSNQGGQGQGQGQNQEALLADVFTSEARRTVVISTVDGRVKICPWDLDGKGSGSALSRLGSSDAPPKVLPGDPQQALTVIHLSADRKLLFAG
jgi:WD40 repeat protein